MYAGCSQNVTVAGLRGSALTLLKLPQSLHGLLIMQPLRQWQIEALDAIEGSNSDAPLVQAVMGAGKARLIVEQCKYAMLVTRAELFRVCVSAPTEALVEQLYADLHSAGLDVGRYYGRHKDPLRQIMVVCYPSIAAMVEAYPGKQWLWIVDECHLTTSDMMLEAKQLLDPYWRIGLTATPFRSGSKKLSLWSDVVYSYGMGRALEDGVLVPWETVHPEVGNRDLDEVCLEMLAQHRPAGGGIVGAKSIEDAELFADALVAAGWQAAPIHSGLAPAVKDRRLDDLKSGALQALVHVDMLTTGVNIPWLRWLMLRRRYTSRTSFLQFFGRGLRSSPGKTSVKIFDPWMQLQHFSLEYAAQLGANGLMSHPQDTPPEDEQEWTLMDLPPFIARERIPHVTARRAASAWCRALLHAAQAARVVVPSEWDADSEWRTKPASDKQRAYLDKISGSTRHLPKGHVRDGAKRLMAFSGALTSGAASDLTSVLMGGLEVGAPYRRLHTHWEWPLLTEVPPLPKRVYQGLKE